VDIDASRVAATPLSPFANQGWRQLSRGYDPLSGEGARINGGRFNPPGSFPVLYVCQSRKCAVAELASRGMKLKKGL
jgi:RES domain-containing protein